MSIAPDRRFTMGRMLFRLACIALLTGTLSACGSKKAADAPCRERPSYDKIAAVLTTEEAGDATLQTNVSVIAVDEACAARTVYYNVQRTVINQQQTTTTTSATAILLPADNGKWYLFWPGKGYPHQLVEVPE